MSECKDSSKQPGQTDPAAEIEHLKEEIAKLQDELKDKDWASKKTNEGIKILYKELEKRNAELKKLDQLKSDFISIASHELRTPLTNAREAIRLVLDRTVGGINEKQDKVLVIAGDNIDRLVRIVNDLLDVSKIEAGKVELRKELINIKNVIDRAISSFETKLKDKGLELRMSLPEKGFDVYADSDKVTQVITNLVSNAIKHTKKGYIEILVEEKADEITCSVFDTGIGIAKEDLGRVFNKFEQFGRRDEPDERGAGLGLSIAKGLVEMHRGSIWVESEVGKGSKFVFTLPKNLSEGG